MRVEPYLYFDGNCREAVEFYAKVFRSEVTNLMAYSDVPASPDFPIAEADRDRVMYAGVPMGEVTMMASDVPSGSPFTVGTNITLAVALPTADEVTRVVAELAADGGTVVMEPQKTFFAEWYGQSTDRFGITWQILVWTPEAA